MTFADSWARRRALIAEWAPFAILLAIMLAWLAMGLDRDYFYRPLIHSSESAETLAMAENLSPSLSFLIFRRAYLREDGETVYDVYARFPIGGYALVKLAILPFGDDFSAKILAARALTLAMFGGAAALFYLALARLLRNRWAALGGVALAFSSHYVLYYSDMIDTERTMGAFGMALTFHGMAVFVREGRVRQLALKSGAAVLLDWQALALLLPFAAFGAAGAAIRAARMAGGERAGKAAVFSAPTEISSVASKTRAAVFPAPTAMSAIASKARAAVFPAPTAMSAIASKARAAVFSVPTAIIAAASKARAVLPPAVLGAARSPHAAVAAIALAAAGAALGFNIANEYAVLGGETPISEMTTVRSAAVRLSGEIAGEFSWTRFLRTELHRAGAAHLSLALPGYGDGLVRMGEGWSPIMAVGAAALAACAAAVFWARKRAPLLAPLALSVFIWDLAIRQYVVTHLYQAQFQFAPALALFSVALLWAGERFGARASAALALAAAAVFTLGAFQMNALAHDDEATEKALMADFEAMREIARGKTVYLDPSIGANASAGFPHDASFFLSGSAIMSVNYEGIIPPDAMQPVIEAADFVLSRERFAGVESLAPNNREAFLYDSRDIAAMRMAEYRALASSGEPAARGEFDLYVEDGGGALVFAKSPCAPADARTRFFLHVYAADFDDLPRDRRLWGFEGLDFPFGKHGAIFGDVCMARADLPDYAIAKIDTGQFTTDEGRTWSAELRFGITDYLWEVYEAAKRREPTARAAFDVYLTRGALTYVRESCDDDDARGRFLVSVFPSDAADLEDGREELRHNSLNFSFEEYGGMVNGRCVMRRPLPEYAVERLEVGQWIPGGAALWRAEIAVGE